MYFENIYFFIGLAFAVIAYYVFAHKTSSNLSEEKISRKLRR